MTSKLVIEINEKPSNLAVGGKIYINLYQLTDGRAVHVFKIYICRNSKPKYTNPSQKRSEK